MESKKKRIISVIALIALALTIIAATYAYFNAQNGDPAAADIKINANTVDTLTFATGNQISFTINQENFASGTGNQTSSTYASALLTANNKTNTATDHYYLYLNIENNTFTYSIDENTPEIIMTVTDTSGTEITDISVLDHVVATGADGKEVSGYDITNKLGLLTLFNNREIRATPSKEEKWNVTITFVNYDQNQKANAGMSMSAKLMIQKKKITLLAEYVKSLYTGTQGDNGIYYHDASLENGAGDNSYRYSGGNAHGDLYSCKYDGNDVMNKNGQKNAANEGDCLNVYKATDGNDIMYLDNSFSDLLTNKQSVSWDSSNNECVTSSGDNVSLFDGSTVTQDACTGTAYYLTLASQYILGIEEVGAGEETLITLADEGVSNYVCFGTSTTPCPTDNLYRIIGVFEDKVKLIKYDYATSSLLGTDGDYKGTGTPNASHYKGSLTTLNTYYWNYKNDTSINNGNGSNEWSTSLFNKINLNTNYLNNIGATWSNMIEDTTWKVSCHTTFDKTPSVMFTAEITNATKTYGPSDGTSKIGLMYASDYGFAADPSAWTTTLYNYNSSTVRTVNWMYMGFSEWTISPYSSYSNYVFYLSNTGTLHGISASIGIGARPVLYLKASVAYAGGSGTKDSPITLGV